MERVTDWVKLWRELVEAGEKRIDQARPQGRGDAWKRKARGFDDQVKRRWAAPDSSREALVARVRAHPGCSLLDIGAGTGAWTALLARHAAQVTAVEPSPAMIQVMEENLAAQGARNVRIVCGPWPLVDVPEHDLSLCAHAMYGVADFPAFVARMEAVTRRTCFLLMRAPTADSVMAQAARRVWGQPYDSPNFQVGYNALLQMGRFPNVLMEDSGLWQPWASDSLEAALADIKRRLGVPEPSPHDAFLLDLLQQSLNRVGGGLTAPVLPHHRTYSSYPAVSTIGLAQRTFRSGLRALET